VTLYMNAACGVIVPLPTVNPGMVVK
jgi:hypothetical protein